VNPIVAGVVAGVLIGLVVSLMATINLTYGAPWAPTHTMVAQVSDADSMSVGSDVRIAGRLVGQVTSVQAAGDHTNVTFHVNSADWPLPSDTTASVRLATLLGQKYIQLNPGHSSERLPDGAVLGVQSVRPVVDFDQILNTFDKPTRDALTSLIRTVGASVQGQEGTIQQLIPDLSDLSVHSQVPTQELVTRNSEFNSILINLGITAQQLGQSRNDLAGVISNLNNVTGTLASNEGKALKSFITNTDHINLTTDAVLGGGYASKLDAGLQKLGTFASYFNSLAATLIPETVSFNSPVTGAEPSDIVHGNGGIPAKAAIDLIYEIADAASQGYGSFDFGSASFPDFQGNFFVRQFAVGSDPCAFVVPPEQPCRNDQTPP
jgi:virulence factor Mce-like protein